MEIDPCIPRLTPNCPNSHLTLAKPAILNQVFNMSAVKYCYSQFADEHNSLRGRFLGHIPQRATVSATAKLAVRSPPHPTITKPSSDNVRSVHPTAGHMDPKLALGLIAARAQSL
jgi:hypothetical protein